MFGGVIAGSERTFFDAMHFFFFLCQVIFHHLSDTHGRIFLNIFFFGQGHLKREKILWKIS